MNKNIEKSFPANTTIDKDSEGKIIKTFLNDPKVNAELYATLLAYSIGEEKETRVYKQDLPSQADIASMLHISSRTLTRHLNYLLTENYITENGKYYTIAHTKIYFRIPLKTVQFFVNTAKSQVLKAYIYLGQKWKFKGSQYEFTLEELGEHIGKKINNNSKTYAVINDILTNLSNNGLISYCEYFNGKTKKKRLLDFSYEVKNSI